MLLIHKIKANIEITRQGFFLTAIITMLMGNKENSSIMDIFLNNFSAHKLSCFLSNPTQCNKSHMLIYRKYENLGDIIVGKKSTQKLANYCLILLFC